jgi:hypothetical protein
LNIYEVTDVKQIHKDEPLVPHPSPLEVEIVTAKG